MAQGATSEKEGAGFKILYQILTTMCIIALIPIGGLWYISIYKSKHDWTANILENLMNSTESLTRSVDDWTTMNLRVLQQNADTPAIQSMQSDRQNPVLKTMADTYDWVYLAFTVLPNGENMGRSDGKPQTFYGDRDYFKQVLAGKSLGQQVLLGKTSGKPAFILAKPIQGEGTRILGVIAIAMSLEDLSKTITKTRIGKTGFAVLLDENNRLIAHGNGDVSSELQDLSAHPALHQRNIFDRNSFVFEEDGKKIVAYTKKTQQGWTLIVQQDYQEAYAAANETERNAIILLLTTLFSVLIIAYLLALRLSTPIRNLTAIADEISRGNLGAKIKETERSDEIGALARAIERMGVSLQMAFDRLRKR
ncbi:HAMP domain-containing protein [Desulfopila sp. IMCC35006]|uniref:cache domain-containing protein n=1 Tax=Desulfopila sp. IMCC35006 TaxID=2569542 RepID=UPI0010ACE4F8|nr:cache and HAMP domain-containing protein [Desulfopila sp. IMCC35006]TKB26174.1 HAMP domain-containing protein [Desulfopila sp. IMCC35006]